MKTQIKFISGWQEFNCEICNESYSVKDMHLEQQAEYDQTTGRTRLARLAIMCEDCSRRMDES